MFRIELFVEDNHLAKVLHAMKGLRVKIASLEPVVNAIVKNGTVRQASAAATAVDRVAAAVMAHEGVEIDVNVLKKMTVEAGASVNSYGTMRNYLVDRKIIRSVARGKFKITKREE